MPVASFVRSPRSKVCRRAFILYAVYKRVPACVCMCVVYVCAQFVHVYTCVFRVLRASRENTRSRFRRVLSFTITDRKRAYRAEHIDFLCSTIIPYPPCRIEKPAPRIGAVARSLAIRHISETFVSIFLAEVTREQATTQITLIVPLTFYRVTESAKRSSDDFFLVRWS